MTSVLAVGAAACILLGVGVWRGRVRRGLSAPACSALATRRMRVIGHRGASAVRPENTLCAFRTALDAGAGFEMDLQLVQTGEVLVLHDDTLRRTATLKGRGTASASAAVLDAPVSQSASAAVLDAPVSQLPLETVQPFEVGSWFDAEWTSESAPLLADALSLLREYAGKPACHTFAELKADGYGMDRGYDAGLPPAAEATVHAQGVTPEQVCGSPRGDPGRWCLLHWRRLSLFYSFPHRRACRAARAHTRDPTAPLRWGSCAPTADVDHLLAAARRRD
eukprot:584955-Prymnesium_polylepis.2